MDKQHIRDEVIRNLRVVAPQVDGTHLADQQPLREQVQLDATGWQNFIEAVHRNLHVDIPQDERARLRTLAELVDYLDGRLGTRPH